MHVEHSNFVPMFVFIPSQYCSACTRHSLLLDICNKETSREECVRISENPRVNHFGKMAA